MRGTAFFFGLFMLLVCRPASAQHWYYDFGTSIDSCTQGVSSTLLPAPPAGNARVRIGSQGGGAYLRQPAAFPLGSGSELCLRAPTGASLNKVQIYDHASGSGFSLRCRMRISSDAGTVYFFTGNGSCFSDNGGFTSAEVFAGLRWVVDSSGTVRCDARLPSGWTALPGGAVTADSAFLFEIYCNNAAVVRSYQHDSAQTVAARRCDIWIDGNRVADDVRKTGLPDTLHIDSFMWYSAQSPSNALRLTLDDVHYLNAIAAQPLPVELEFFRADPAGNGVALSWRTVTEANSYGFVVERRRVPSGAWRQLDFLPAAGCSTSPREYAWSDSSACVGMTYRYRLLLQDRDGSVDHSPEREISLPAGDTHPGITDAWPQPAAHTLQLTVSLLRPAPALRLRVRTLTGEIVTERAVGRLLPAGRHVLSFPCSAWPRGCLVCEVLNGRDRYLRTILLH